jgi:hypothetical protein
MFNYDKHFHWPNRPNCWDQCDTNKEIKITNKVFKSHLGLYFKEHISIMSKKLVTQIYFFTIKQFNFFSEIPFERDQQDVEPREGCQRRETGPPERHPEAQGATSSSTQILIPAFKCLNKLDFK